MKKKENLLSVYAVVSQLGYTIIAPLLIFLVGGNYVVKRFELPDWIMGICVALGIIFMISGAAVYISKLLKMYAKDNKSAPKSYNPPSDNDYYDDYKDLRK